MKDEMMKRVVENVMDLVAINRDLGIALAEALDDAGIIEEALDMEEVAKQWQDKHTEEVIEESKKHHFYNMTAPGGE